MKTIVISVTATLVTFFILKKYIVLQGPPVMPGPCGATGMSGIPGIPYQPPINKWRHRYQKFVANLSWSWW